jgi:hypothetical protein
VAASTNFAVIRALHYPDSPHASQPLAVEKYILEMHEIDPPDKRLKIDYAVWNRRPFIEYIYGFLSVESLVGVWIEDLLQEI